MPAPLRRRAARPLGLALLAVLALAATGGTMADAQPEPPTTTSTPPPAPPSSEPPAEPAPPADPAPAPTAPTSPVPRGVVPPGVRAIINSVRRTPANNTRRLLSAARGLTGLGLTEGQALAASFGRFPVEGYATFSHDWLFPRYVPSFHLHMGTDLFAVAGTPVRAPADGQLKLSQGAVGGLAAYVYQSDGTYFYMAHLRSFVAGQRSGQSVKLGEIVGYVGATGNAQGGAPHVHFEIHPAPSRSIVSGQGQGRTVREVVRPVPMGTVLPAVDPKPYLDQWLAEALAAVPRLLGSVESRPRAVLATGLTRRISGGRAGAFPSPVTPGRSQLLWVSSASPSGGALALAQAEALTAATELDWSAMADRQQAQLELERQAEARSTAILERLTPEPLRRAGNEG